MSGKITLLLRDSNDKVDAPFDSTQSVMLIKQLLFCLLLLDLSACASSPWTANQAPKSRQDGLVTAPAVSVGSNTTHLAKLVSDAGSGKWGNVDSLLILKDNKLVLESYFRGNQWDQPHELRSLTKSLLSAGYGAAISHKLIQDVHLPVYEIFEHASSFDNPNPEKKLMTFAHVMSMTAGLACEDMSKPTNPCGGRLFESTSPLRSKLQVPPWQRALNLPLAHTPGTVFVYNDAAPVIVDGLLSGLMHMETNDFLRLVMFKPMQIGVRSSLFRLTGRDLIKFGQLYLNGGVWNGKRLLLQSWVEDSISVKWQFPDMPPETGYGYFWWISGVDIDGRREKIFYALGNGGQAVFVVPKLQLVFVTTATNFDRFDLIRGPMDMLKQHVIPAFSNVVKGE